MTTPTKPVPSTLRDVFENLSRDAANVDLAGDEAISAEAKKQAGPVEWAASSSLVPHVAELLNVPLPEVLVRYWQQADEVAAEIEESKKSPGKRRVTLLETKTEAAYEPAIQVRLNGAKAGKPIGFKVVIPLTLKGAILVIEGGQIAGVVAGECAIEGAIKLGSLTLAKLKKPVVVSLAEVPGLQAS